MPRIERSIGAHNSQKRSVRTRQSKALGLSLFKRLQAIRKRNFSSAKRCYSDYSERLIALASLQNLSQNTSDSEMLRRRFSLLVVTHRIFVLRRDRGRNRLLYNLTLVYARVRVYAFFNFDHLHFLNWCLRRRARQREGGHLRIIRAQ